MKKPFRALLSRPLFWCFAVMLVLAPFGLGFFVTEPESPRTPDFNTSEAALTAAYEKAVAESDPENAAHRQKILFYETALRFSLDVWNSQLLTEMAGTYAATVGEWEILLSREDTARSPRSLLLEQRETELKHLLEAPDRGAYLSFLKKSYLADEKSPEEASLLCHEASLRIAAADGSPGEKMLLQEIRLLEESLADSIDHYHATTRGRALSEDDAEELSRLLRLRTHQWETGAWDPVPANTEALQQAQEILVLLFLTFWCFAAWPKEDDRPSPLFLCSLPVLLLLPAAALSLATLLFAPESALGTPFSVGNSIGTLPFPLTLWLRLLLQSLPGIPFSLVVLWAKKRWNRPKATLLGTGFALLLYFFLSFFLRLLLARSSWRFALPFLYLDALSLVFPQAPEYLPPAPGVFSVLFGYGLSLWASARLAFPPSQRKNGDTSL